MCFMCMSECVYNSVCVCVCVCVCVLDLKHVSCFLCLCIWECVSMCMYV